MTNLRDTYRLSNGVEIPCLGFGTWRTPEGAVAVDAVTEAIRAGYRHIDTAAYYGNETSIGEAIRKSVVRREEIFITSKVWNTERGYDKTKAAFFATLERLGLDYLDLYLIHWPAAPHQHENWEELNRETWRAMTELYHGGKIRAIGVSNFMPHHLKALMETDVVPMVNQIEFHPGQRQEETAEYCKAHGILVEAWSPMARGKLADHPLLTELAAKYRRSVPQICLRWCLQHQVLPLPKSVTPSRIRENTQVFDFALSKEDMAALDALPLVGSSGHHPDKIAF